MRDRDSESGLPGSDSILIAHRSIRAKRPLSITSNHLELNTWARKNVKLFVLCLDKLSAEMTIIVRNNTPGSDLCKLLRANIPQGLLLVKMLHILVNIQTLNLSQYFPGPARDSSVSPVCLRVSAPSLLPAPLRRVWSRLRRLCRRVHPGVAAASADCRPLPRDNLPAELLTPSGESTGYPMCCLHWSNALEACQCLTFFLRVTVRMSRRCYQICNHKILFITIDKISFLPYSTLCEQKKARIGCKMPRRPHTLQGPCVLG